MHALSSFLARERGAEDAIQSEEGSQMVTPLACRYATHSLSPVRTCTARRKAHAKISITISNDANLLKPRAFLALQGVHTHSCAFQSKKPPAHTRGAMHAAPSFTYKSDSPLQIVCHSCMPCCPWRWHLDMYRLSKKCCARVRRANKYIVSLLHTTG